MKQFLTSTHSWTRVGLGIIITLMFGNISGMKPTIKYTGNIPHLQNCGNNCYVNASVQALYNLKALTDFLLDPTTKINVEDDLLLAYQNVVKGFSKKSSSYDAMDKLTDIIVAKYTIKVTINSLEDARREVEKAMKQPTPFSKDEKELVNNIADDVWRTIEKKDINYLTVQRSFNQLWDLGMKPYATFKNHPLSNEMMATVIISLAQDTLNIGHADPGEFLRPLLEQIKKYTDLFTIKGTIGVYESKGNKSLLNIPGNVEYDYFSLNADELKEVNRPEPKNIKEAIAFNATTLVDQYRAEVGRTKGKLYTDFSAEKREIYTNSPKILALQINKLNREAWKGIDVEEKIKWNLFTNFNEPSVTYDLRSAIVYSGAHFEALIKVGRTWWRCNDDVIGDQDYNEALDVIKKSQFLFYEVLLQAGESTSGTQKTPIEEPKKPSEPKKPEIPPAEPTKPPVDKPTVPPVKSEVPPKKEPITPPVMPPTKPTADLRGPLNNLTQALNQLARNL